MPLLLSLEDQLPPGFPTIDMGPQLKVVERSRTATMLCAASGNPDPEISWFKDFLPVNTSSNNGRIKQLRSGDPSFLPITFQDELAPPTLTAAGAPRPRSPFSFLLLAASLCWGCNSTLRGLKELVRNTLRSSRARHHHEGVVSTTYTVTWLIGFLLVSLWKMGAGDGDVLRERPP